ncbi:leucine-rich repeat protein [Phyllosticta capitalensis]
MDPSSSSKLPRPSGIPRPPTTKSSKLPIPSSLPQRSKTPQPTSSTPRAIPTSSLPGRAASTTRPSLASSSRPPAVKDDSVFKKPAPPRPMSRQARSRIQRPAVAAISTRLEQQEDDQLGDLNGFRVSSRMSHRDSPAGDWEDEELLSIPQFDSRKRDVSTASLSDRAAETIQNIMLHQPTSPTSRQTSWMGPTSPRGIPSRPASAMSRPARPESRNSILRGTGQGRPITPSGMSYLSSSMRASFGGAMGPSLSTSTPTRRSASAAPKSPATYASGLQAQSPEDDFLKSPIKSPIKSPMKSPGSRVSKTPIGAGQSMIGRVPKTRTAANVDLESPTADATQTSPVRSPPKRATPKAAPRTTPKSGSKKEPKSPETTKKTSSSSSALREQIAKAKAAAKKTATPAKSLDQGPNFESYEDPFNQMPRGGDAVIKKRVAAARSEGRLNIANMGLSEIPSQVMSMYEYDPESNVAWSEAVDLVRFVAADNDIERLPDDLFPDIDPTDFAEDLDATGPQFGGVETLDLHGNILKELPLGLRRLENLTVLNLSRNRLGNGCMDIISQITCVRELRLSDNALHGEFPESLGSLTSLELLDLQGNKVTRLPDSLRELASLKTLHVSNNAFSSLPVEILQGLPLVDLQASKNALGGTLFPDTVACMPRLQTLNVSSNALGVLCSSKVAMPALQSLNLAINRISELPDLSEWSNLITLLVEENKLSVLPAGFTTLKKLRHANFSGNNVNKIENEIGLMESLERLDLAANPLRERKFITLNTNDLKRDLKMRLDPTSNQDDSAAVGADDVEQPTSVIPPKDTWTTTPSGTLDLSSKTMSELSAEKLSAIDSPVRSLTLHHNAFTSLPTSLSLIASTLNTLDLSSNRLSSTALLSGPLSLPYLASLRLTANGLTSLAPLTDALSAPRLATLDVTANRLTGALPVLRTSFPSLTTLLAADNSIDDISVTALAGLNSVDLSNNAIARLPPEVGLLGDAEAGGTLKAIELRGNVFRVPAWPILQRGTAAVLEWCRGRITEDGPQSVDEAVAMEQGEVGDEENTWHNGGDGVEDEVEDSALLEEMEEVGPEGLGLSSTASHVPAGAVGFDDDETF